MSKKKILLFSTEAGLAHVTRTIAVGTELKKLGHRVIFAITKSEHAMVRENGLEVVDAPEILSDRTIGSQAVHNWYDSSYLAKFAKSDLAIVQNVKPDSLLVDLRVSSIIAGLSMKIPMAFLTGTGALPGVCHIPMLVDPIRPAVRWIIDQGKKRALRALFRAAKSLGVSISMEEGIRSLTYIVPEASWYLPNSRKDLKVFYVGPIFWNKFDTQIPNWLTTMKPNGKTIYVTFGGTAYDGQKLIAICSALVSRGFRVIVSASNIVPVNKFPKEKNLFVAKYLSGFAASRASDLVLCHGGYGTLMQAVLSGKPLVVVPYNFDQVLHGFRFQELGLARAVTQIRPRDIVNQGWNMLFHMGRFVPVPKILEAVDEVLQNKRQYYRAIDIFQKRLGDTNGALAAARIVENL